MFTADGAARRAAAFRLWRAYIRSAIDRVPILHRLLRLSININSTKLS